MTTRRDEMKSNETNLGVLEIRPRKCRFPECSRRVAATGRPGRPSSYCDRPDHNAQTAFRERPKGGRLAVADQPVTAGLTELGQLVAELSAHRAALAELLGDTDAVLELVTDRTAIDGEIAAVRAAAEADVAQARAKQAEAEHAAVLMRAERDAAVSARDLAEEAAEEAIADAEQRADAVESAAARVQTAGEQTAADAGRQLGAMRTRLEEVEAAKRKAETRADEMARVANGRRLDAERFESHLANERKAHNREISGLREQLDNARREHAEDLRGAVKAGVESAARHIGAVRVRSARPRPVRRVSSAQRRT
ncbi:hypothetical protein ACQPW1_39580 [Nocardia sp. CA-128927]|uniref:hypothetical protein n=1 Tax=Nocardia sp. CA-128927 TaxID=3239975 RepID=UPI003D98CB13